MRVQITRPRSNQVVLELDGAAICDEAVLLVESKTHLVIEDVTDLIMRMDKLECAPSAMFLRSKSLQRQCSTECSSTSALPLGLSQIIPF